MYATYCVHTSQILSHQLFNLNRSMRRLFPFIIFITLLGGILWAQNNSSRLQDALNELQTRADSDEPKALFELARLYENGYDSIAPDSMKSEELYIKSAILGYPPAMNLIGYRHFNRQDTGSAIFWIKKAADAGDATAFSNLGYLYTQFEKYAEAEQWLEKAVEAGVPSAISQLGDFKRMGLTSSSDTIAAIALYDRAIEAGDWDSQYKLLAMMGHKWQVLPGKEALKLGIKYYKGYAPVAGVELLEIAARDSVPQAMGLLGDAYSRGIGVEYDPAKALQYFHDAALAGNAPSQFLIAELLDFFPDEFDEDADYWREKAEAEGIKDADAAYKALFTFSETE